MLILFSYNNCPNESAGVTKKVNDQIVALGKLGATVEKKFLSGSIIKKIITAFSDIVLSDFDGIFIRNTGFYLFFQCLAIRIKGKSLVIIEFPTPISASFLEIKKSERLWLRAWAKIFFLRLIYPRALSCADIIIEYASDDFLDSRRHAPKLITIGNGYNPTDETKHALNVNIDTSTINILTVAKISYWHGVDRAIRGVAAYYGETDKAAKPRLVLHIAGDGEELRQLKDLCQQLEIGQHVNFHGPLTHAGIAKLAAISLFGLGSLANHRKNLMQESSLKAREYCAMGLPFVLTCEDADFPASLEFVKYEEMNDNPLNFDKLIAYFAKIDRNWAVTTMTNYSQNKLSWEAQMSPVMEKMRKIDALQK